MPVRLTHDAVYGGESLASPFSSILGGEKRLENAFLGFGVDPHSRVLEAEHHIRSRLDVVRQVLGGFLGGACVHSQGDLSPVRHGVAGVGGEIDEDLLERGPIQVHENGIFGEAKVEFDVFWNESPQNLLHILGDLYRIQHLRLQVLVPSAEGKQLLGQVRRPLCRFANFAKYFESVSSSFFASRMRSENERRTARILLKS